MVCFGNRKTKVAPDAYPKLYFHGLRALQLLSSLVVGSIMVYFIYYLSHDHWNIPWTFIFFTAAAGTTIAALCTTIVLHCCFGLNPRTNLFINGGLFMLWGAAFGMLSWWASKTLTHRCKIEDWNDETGVMVCRIYKALYAFGCCGFLSTVCALILDIWVYREANKSGIYRKANERGNFLKVPNDKAGVVPYNDVEMPAFHRSRPAVNPASGYGVPEEQFGYDDTTYHGAHPPQARYSH